MNRFAAVFVLFALIGCNARPTGPQASQPAPSKTAEPTAVKPQPQEKPIQVDNYIDLHLLFKGNPAKADLTYKGNLVRLKLYPVLVNKVDKAGAGYVYFLPCSSPVGSDGVYCHFTKADDLADIETKLAKSAIIGRVSDWQRGDRLILTDCRVVPNE